MKKLIGLALTVLVLSGWDHGGVGVQASRARDFTNSIGANTHLSNNALYTQSSVSTDLTYLGINSIREGTLYTGNPATTAINNLAAAGVKFNFSTGSFGCTGTADSQMATVKSLWDGFVASAPGALLSIEGMNEINNSPVCYMNTQVTNGATRIGNSTLNFASTMPSMLPVASAGYGSGVTITDSTTSAAIPSSTTVFAAATNNITMSANAASPGVGSGDTIQFEANGVGQPSTDARVSASGIAWQQDIFNTVHGDSNLSGVKVLNFTDYVPGLPFGGQIGVPGTADTNTQHIYPAGGQPSAFYINPTTAAADGYYIIPGLLLWVTETGFYLMPDGVSGVDATTQAILTLTNLLDEFNLGVPHTFLYDLIDDACDAGNTNPQDHYGLFTCSNSPKTVATAIQSLTTIMADGGGTASTFIPGRLAYSATNLPALNFTTQGGGYTFLFQKSNGHFFIAVWNEPLIWNNSTQTEITPSTVSSVVSLGQTFTTVNVYDPMVGTSPVSTASGVSSVTLSLIKDPLIVECIP